MPSGLHEVTSAVMPRNILKATFEITSPVSRKSEQLVIPDFARNSSIRRTPMLWPLEFPGPKSHNHQHIHNAYTPIARRNNPNTHIFSSCSLIASTSS